MEEFAVLGFGLKVLEVGLELGIGVGVAVGDENFVVLMFKCVGKGQRIKLLRLHMLSRNPITKIRNALPIPHPPLPCQLIMLFRIHQGLHSMIKQRVSFDKIYNVELHTPLHLSIMNTEEEPLCMPLRIRIVLAEEVIFIFANFTRQHQVPTFKPGLEHQRGVLRRNPRIPWS